MTIEEIVRRMDERGRFGDPDPDCDCDSCKDDRALRAKLDAPSATASAE